MNERTINRRRAIDSHSFEALQLSSIGCFFGIWKAFYLFAKQDQKFKELYEVIPACCGRACIRGQTLPNFLKCLTDYLLDPRRRNCLKSLPQRAHRWNIQFPLGSGYISTNCIEHSRVLLLSSNRFWSATQRGYRKSEFRMSALKP